MTSDHGSVEILACKFCASSQVEPVFTEFMGGSGYTSYYCGSCDLYQTLGDIAEVSPDYVSLGANDLDDFHIFLQTAHKRKAFDQWLKLFRRHARTGAGGRLLDVGCGVGGFLDYAAGQGFDAFGFDASAAQAAAASKRHPNVRHGIDIDQYVAGFAAPVQFDAITLWDVFEHIRTPADLLASARRHLAPGGLIFVSVPNGAANPIKVRLSAVRGRPPGLIPWEHVFYYTRRSLARVFADNGLEPVVVGAVIAYDRPLSIHEIARRVAFRVLERTKIAPQIFALARIAG